MHIRHYEDGYKIELCFLHQRADITVVRGDGVIIPHLKKLDWHDMERLSYAIGLAQKLLIGEVTIEGGPM